MRLLIYKDDFNSDSDSDESMEVYRDLYTYNIKEEKICPDYYFKNPKIKKKKYIIQFEKKLDKLLKNKNRGLVNFLL